MVQRHDRGCDEMMREVEDTRCLHLSSQPGPRQAEIRQPTAREKFALGVGRDPLLPATYPDPRSTRVAKGHVCSPPRRSSLAARASRTCMRDPAACCLPDRQRGAGRGGFGSLECIPPYASTVETPYAKLRRRSMHVVCSARC